MDDDALLSAAQQLADQLRNSGRKIVFAESCTAGLVAATLARVPGISEHLCGSAVVYRNATKSAWLDVSADDLADPHIGPVSETVATAMASGVLRRTPEADIAASVTGHLGPDAPTGFDGVIYVGIARREPAGTNVHIEYTLRHTLLEAIESSTPETLRHDRQQYAAIFVLQIAAGAIASSD